MIIIGTAALVTVVARALRIRCRGAMKVAVNSLAGAALIAGLSAFDILVLPLNLFNVLTVGFLGLPGVGVVVAASLLL